MSTVPHHAGPTRSLPGVKAVEHRFEVPLDHDDPGGDAIEVFMRELRAAAKADESRPYLLMLNGGPGFPAQRPAKPGSWLKRALEDYHVLLLDQRGTGLSTPQTRQTLESLEPEQQADRLKRFRADSIVQDAELARRALLGGGRWSVLGQSYGGFATMSYLSTAPEGLAEAFVTGGLPPLDRSVDDVYRATFERLDRHIDRYLERYPGDAERWRRVFEHAETADERFPGGRHVSARALKALGIELGVSNGPEKLHYLVELAWAGDDRFSDEFLQGAEAALSFIGHPIYALLHEPIYSQGDATRWSAARVLEGRGEPLFFGEMIFPWMFEEDPALRPLWEAADILANADGWAPLYETERLARNEVPAAAAVYLDDMYVESGFQLETAARVKGLRAWATNEFDHDGIHVGPVLDRLIALRRGEL